MTNDNGESKHPGQILFSAVARAIEHLELSSDETQQILGSSIDKIAEQLNSADYGFTDSGVRRAVQFVRIFSALSQHCGNDILVMRQWLRQSNSALNSEPLAYMDNEKALERVIAYLEQR